jgi:hypothetical protein
MHDCTLSAEDVLAIGKCFHFRRVDCHFPMDFETSILGNFTHLQDLGLGSVDLSVWDVEVISQSCPSLKDVLRTYVTSSGDRELRCLVESCPTLRSLSLCGV